jgi:hypothetical protein
VTTSSITAVALGTLLSFVSHAAFGQTPAPAAPRPASAAPPPPSAAAPPPPPSAAPPPAAPAAPPFDSPAAGARTAADTQREALFDIAFNAVAAGDLALAEQAFRQAAQLPGDPAVRAIVDSFVARVSRMRALQAQLGGRALQPPASGPEAAPKRAPSLSPAPSPSPARDRSGRLPFLLTSTALGLGAYGWSFPGMLGVTADESPRTFIGLYMLTAGASFFAPYMVTRDRPVSAGQANLAFWGGTRSLYLGVLSAALLGGNVNPEIAYRPFAAGIFLGSVTGLVGGFWYAGRAQLTAGQARTMGLMGDFGLGLGFGAGLLLDFDSSDRSQDQRARLMAASGLLGTAAGLVGGYVLAHRRDNTWGDGEVMRAAGIGGAWTGFVASYALNADDKPIIASAMAGGLVGLVAGDRLILGTDFTVGQSILIDLAGVVGALAAPGLLYLVSPEDWNEDPFLVASVVGGLASFGGMYWLFRERGADDDVGASAGKLFPRGVALVPAVGAAGQRGINLLGAF